MRNIKGPNVCVISGFGWSGSGAVVDILREIKVTRALDVEYRTIKDPYGILDLEKALTSHWDILNSDYALRNFIKLSEMHGEVNSKISKYRLSYEKKINKDFKEITADYVQSFIKTELKFTWWQRQLHSSWIKHIFAKLAAKLRTLPSTYLALSDKSEFLENTRNYLEKLLLIKGHELLLLDQAVSPNNIEEGLKFFRNACMLIVDRNPYDILADLRKNKALMGLRNDIKHLEAFVDFYKVSRVGIRSPLPHNVKIVNFEKLVNNYSMERKEILDFLSLSENENPPTFRIFDPEISKANIGIFKEFLEKDEIDYISRKLNTSPPYS